jgi:hypothetical protein
MKKTILYCSDNRIDQHILRLVRQHILTAKLPVVSVTHEPLEFGQNICVGNIGHSLKSYASQLMVGLSMIQTGVVYIVEHDVLYHPSHFKLLPANPRMGYFDTNRWIGVVADGCYYNWAKTSPFGLRALSMSLGYVDFFLEHISRLAIRIWNGWKSQITPWDCTACIEAEGPSVDIRHAKNLTKDEKWKRSDVRLDSLDPWGTLSEALST